MKTITEIKQILQTQKSYLAEKYGVTEMGVFGSYVRGEQRPDSDLDILIELEAPPRIREVCDQLKLNDSARHHFCPQPRGVIARDALDLLPRAVLQYDIVIAGFYVHA